MRKAFYYLTTSAVFYFLTVQQALATGTGGANVPQLEQGVKAVVGSVTGSLASDITAIGLAGGAVAGLMMPHGPVLMRVGSGVMVGGFLTNIRPAMTALGMGGATF